MTTNGGSTLSGVRYAQRSAWADHGQHGRTVDVAPFSFTRSSLRSSGALGSLIAVVVVTVAVCLVGVVLLYRHLARRQRGGVLSQQDGQDGEDAPHQGVGLSHDEVPQKGGDERDAVPVEGVVLIAEEGAAPMGGGDEGADVDCPQPSDSPQHRDPHRRSMCNSCAHYIRSILRRAHASIHPSYYIAAYASLVAVLCCVCVVLGGYYGSTRERVAAYDAVILEFDDASDLTSSSIGDNASSSPSAAVDSYRPTRMSRVGADDTCRRAQVIGGLADGGNGLFVRALCGHVDGVAAEVAFIANTSLRACASGSEDSSGAASYTIAPTGQWAASPSALGLPSLSGVNASAMVLCLARVASDALFEGGRRITVPTRATAMGSGASPTIVVMPPLLSSASPAVVVPVAPAPPRYLSAFGDALRDTFAIGTRLYSMPRVGLSLGSSDGEANALGRAYGLVPSFVSTSSPLSLVGRVFDAVVPVLIDSSAPSTEPLRYAVEGDDGRLVNASPSNLFTEKELMLVPRGPAEVLASSSSSLSSSLAAVTPANVSFAFSGHGNDTLRYANIGMSSLDLGLLMSGGSAEASEGCSVTVWVKLSRVSSGFVFAVTDNVELVEVSGSASEEDIVSSESTPTASVSNASVAATSSVSNPLLGRVASNIRSGLTTSAPMGAFAAEESRYGDEDWREELSEGGGGNSDDANGLLRVYMGLFADGPSGTLSLVTYTAVPSPSPMLSSSTAASGAVRSREEARRTKLRVWQPNGRGGGGDDDSSSDANEKKSLLDAIVFDDQWHFISIVVGKESGARTAQLFVDGRTSYADKAWHVCLPADPDDAEGDAGRLHPIKHLSSLTEFPTLSTSATTVRPSSSSSASSNTTTTALMASSGSSAASSGPTFISHSAISQGGVLHVGHIKGAVADMRVYHSALTHEAVIALGGGGAAMRRHLSIDVASSKGLGYALLAGAIVGLVAAVVLLARGEAADATLKSGDASSEAAIFTSVHKTSPPPSPSPAANNNVLATSPRRAYRSPTMHDGDGDVGGGAAMEEPAFSPREEMDAKPSTNGDDGREGSGDDDAHRRVGLQVRQGGGAFVAPTLELPKVSYFGGGGPTAAGGGPITASPSMLRNVCNSMLDFLTPILSVTQSIGIYFQGWAWPAAFTAYMDWVVTWFSVDLNIAFPSISYLAMPALQLIGAILAMAFLIAFLLRDDETFVASVRDKEGVPNPTIGDALPVWFEGEVVGVPTEGPPPPAAHHGDADADDDGVERDDGGGDAVVAFGVDGDSPLNKPKYVGRGEACNEANATLSAYGGDGGTDAHSAGTTCSYSPPLPKFPDGSQAATVVSMLTTTLGATSVIAVRSSSSVSDASPSPPRTAPAAAAAAVIGEPATIRFVLKDQSVVRRILQVAGRLARSDLDLSGGGGEEGADDTVESGADRCGVFAPSRDGASLDLDSFYRIPMVHVEPDRSVTIMLEMPDTGECLFAYIKAFRAPQTLCPLHGRSAAGPEEDGGGEEGIDGVVQPTAAPLNSQQHLVESIPSLHHAVRDANGQPRYQCAYSDPDAEGLSVIGLTTRPAKGGAPPAAKGKGPSGDATESANHGACKNAVAHQSICAGISEEFFVCPVAGCMFAVCPACYGGVVPKLKAKGLAQLFLITSFGLWPWVGMVALLAAQSVYLPITKTALMILACHRTFWCTIPQCYEDPSPTFIALATLAAAICAVVGVGMVAFFAYLLWRRQRCVQEAIGEAALDDEVNGDESAGEGGAANGGSTMVRQQAERERQWGDIVMRDRSLLKALYNAYCLEWMYVYPCVLAFRMALVVATVFSTPDSLAQIAAVSAIEGAQLLFWLLVNPFSKRWIGFLTHMGSVHQLGQLCLLCFHRVTVQEDPSNDAYAKGMWWLFVAYLAVFVLIIGGTVVAPILHSLFTPDPVKGASRRLAACVARARTIQALYARMPTVELTAPPLPPVGDGGGDVGGKTAAATSGDQQKERDAFAEWVALVRRHVPPTEHLAEARRAVLRCVGTAASEAAHYEEAHWDALGERGDYAALCTTRRHLTPRFLAKGGLYSDLSLRRFLTAMPTEVAVIRRVIDEGNSYNAYWPSSRRTRFAVLAEVNPSLTLLERELREEEHFMSEVHHLAADPGMSDDALEREMAASSSSSCDAFSKQRAFPFGHWCRWADILCDVSDVLRRRRLFLLGAPIPLQQGLDGEGLDGDSSNANTEGGGDEGPAAAVHVEGGPLAAVYERVVRRGLVHTFRLLRRIDGGSRLDPALCSMAASLDNVPMLRLLLEAGCDVSAPRHSAATSPRKQPPAAPTNMRRSPFHDVASEEAVEVLATISGADINATVRVGNLKSYFVGLNGFAGVGTDAELLTPLHLAMLRALNVTSCLMRIDDEDGHYTFMHGTADRDNPLIRAIIALARHGADVNATSATVGTPLAIAAAGQRLDLVTLLVEELGADVETRSTEHFRTPLATAVLSNCVEVAEYLLTRGRGDPNPTLRSGEVPMHLAARGGNIAMVEVLLQHGGNPNLSDYAPHLGLTDNEHMTPLLAAYINQLDDDQEDALAVRQFFCAFRDASARHGYAIQPYMAAVGAEADADGAAAAQQQEDEGGEGAGDEEGYRPAPKVDGGDEGEEGPSHCGEEAYCGADDHPLIPEEVPRQPEENEAEGHDGKEEDGGEGMMRGDDAVCPPEEEEEEGADYTTPDEEEAASESGDVPPPTYGDDADRCSAGGEGDWAATGDDTPQQIEILRQVFRGDASMLFLAADTAATAEDGEMGSDDAICCKKAQPANAAGPSSSSPPSLTLTRSALQSLLRHHYACCDGSTLLHVAVANGHLAVVEAILALCSARQGVEAAEGVAVGGTGKGRDLPLLLEDLLTAARRCDGATPLHLAVRYGHTAIAHCLLMAAMKASSSMPPLLAANHDDGTAAQGGGGADDESTRCSSTLLGRVVNAASMGGRTPLFIAAMYGREAILRTLLSRAPPSAHSPAYSYLCCGAGGGGVSSLNARARVVRVGAGEVEAGPFGTYEADDGFEHEYTDECEGQADEQPNHPTDLMTPLMAAIKNNHVGCVELLLAHRRRRDGGGTDDVDDDGGCCCCGCDDRVDLKGALCLAVRLDKLAVVRRLCYAGPYGGDDGGLDVNDGFPLFTAVQQGCSDAIALALLAKEGLVVEPDSTLTTVLHAAVKRGNLAIVKALLARDDVKPSEYASEEVLPPLSLACRAGYAAIAEALLHTLPNLVCVSPQGAPLFVAAQSGHGLIVRMLLGAGAATEDYGGPEGTVLGLALEEARARRHPAVVALLEEVQGEK